MKEIEINGVIIQYNKTNIKILDSYKIKGYIEMCIILNKFVQTTKYKHIRTLDNMISEWQIHNLLYKLCIIRKHTKDCDLEYNKTFINKYIYPLISLFIGG